MGSYTYLPKGGRRDSGAADWDMISDLASPEPPKADVPTLYFAGEHCDDLGWQCVHGACESGIAAADAILGHMGLARVGDKERAKAAAAVKRKSAKL
jgi:Flavin containing amine oxidoreductase